MDFQLEESRQTSKVVLKYAWATRASHIRSLGARILPFDSFVPPCVRTCPRRIMHASIPFVFSNMETKGPLLDKAIIPRLKM